MNYQSRRLGSEGQALAISSKMSSLLSYFISILTPWSFPASVQESGRTPQPSPSTPSSLFQYKCHRLVDQVAREVDDWFLKNWKFENERSRRKFVAAGFSRVTCLYFPMACTLYLLSKIFLSWSVSELTCLPQKRNADSETFKWTIESILRASCSQFSSSLMVGP